jgi:hypothetical protein
MLSRPEFADHRYKWYTKLGAVKRSNMNKLTVRYKRWLVRRSRNGAKRRSLNRHIVTAWFGDRVEEVLCVREPRRPPAVICLEKNLIETLSFLDDWRNRHAIRSSVADPKRYQWSIKPKRKGKLRRINGYVDYSNIEFISTAAALVIAAEYDRAGRLMESVPPTINLKHWSDSVFAKLYELGFFEIVRLSENVDRLYQDAGEVRTMRIVSGTNAADLQRTSEDLIQLSKFIDEGGPLSEDTIFALNSALSEAMVNVARHAYPRDYEFSYKHVDSWWVTASAHRGNKRLTVVMYDQGASIPVTFPKKDWTRAVQDFVVRNLTLHKEFEYQDDSTFIKGAMRRGQTQTGEPGRGEGLPQMMELIDVCGAGSLTIWSRGGVCRYVMGREIESYSYPCSVGGTLIEWVIDLTGMVKNGN